MSASRRRRGIAYFIEVRKQRGKREKEGKEKGEREYRVFQFVYLMCMCMHLCECMPHVCWCLWWPEEGVRSQETVVTG